MESLLYLLFSSLYKPASRTRKNVFISSPSNEGGGRILDNNRENSESRVFISSPSNEGGGKKKRGTKHTIIAFSLVLLQTKVVG